MREDDIRIAIEEIKEFQVGEHFVVKEHSYSSPLLHYFSMELDKWPIVFSDTDSQRIAMFILNALCANNERKLKQ
jgi:hypothetical protein